MKNYKQPGKTLEITGLSTDVKAGYIYRRTGHSSAMAKAWIGVVPDDILGTSTALTTLDGRPIVIGDGVAAEAQYGSGKGDMILEGVFTSPLPTSGMLVRDSDPVYMQVASVAAPGTVASGVTVNQDAAFNRFAISGALVGFAVGSNYTATQSPYTGMNVVDYKLIALPLHGIVGAAPSASV